MFLLIESVDNYQFVRGVFESNLKAQDAIQELDKTVSFVGKYEIHAVALNEIVNIG